MRTSFEKVFSHWTLLFLNLAIIVLVEATGMFFMNTGLIHLITLLFVALGIARIFFHYDVYDQFLRPFLHGGIAILILFAVSHILEYAGYVYFHLPSDTIAAIVVNFYITGLLIIALSVVYFLKRLEKGLAIYEYILPIGMAVTLLATIVWYVRPSLVHLGPSTWLMYVYGGSVVGVAALGITLLTRLKRRVRMLVGFIDYFNASFVLIAVSAMFYVLRYVLEGAGVAYMQAMYTSHFLFYGALSLIFLSFVRLSNLGGVYEEIKKKH